MVKARKLALVISPKSAAVRFNSAIRSGAITALTTRNR